MARCETPRPEISIIETRRVLDVLEMVHDQFIGMVEVGVVGVNLLAARAIAKDLGFPTDTSFWVLFREAANALVRLRVDEASEKNKGK